MVLCGVLIGAMLPMLFSALTMLSVGKAAAEIIEEVRRQFRTQTNEHGVTLLQAIQFATELPEGTRLPAEQEVKPDSDRCVAISTRSSIREMIAPGAFAILVPLAVGLGAGPRCLIGTLAGGIAAGCMMAILMSNAGGAWDNSKKLCEKLQLKKTDQGKACVVGDTVGDPFKDTSGPALNILIKLMSMVSLTVAPALQGKEDWAQWETGIAPLVVLLIVIAALVKMDVLTWSDPPAAQPLPGVLTSPQLKPEEKPADKISTPTAMDL
jgi:inorganic pyrophosphatase